MLLLGALLLAVAGFTARVLAQSCPPMTVTITRPVPPAQNLGGTARVDVSFSSPPAGWYWFGFQVQLLDQNGDLLEVGQLTEVAGLTGHYDLETFNHPDGTYQIRIFAILSPQPGFGDC
jgi:hypothetical protein